MTESGRLQSPNMSTVPTDISTEEGWHELDDGHKVYTKTWKTSEVPRARLIVLHGFSDHCNDFIPLFPLLAAKGIEIFGVDQRGWGRSVKSAKERGRTGGSDQVMADINSYLRRYLPSFPQASTTKPDAIPLFLFGHSMGGGEVIYHASKFPSSEIRGYLASASWIKLSPEMQPSSVLVAGGRFIKRFAPNFQMKQPVHPEWLSHDPEVVRTAKLDELCHDMATMAQADGALSRGDAIYTGKARVSSKQGVRSFFVCHGTADKICDYDGSLQFYNKYCDVGDKELKTYEGWMHKREHTLSAFGSLLTNSLRAVHDEGPYERKIEHANDIASWILARSD